MQLKLFTHLMNDDSPIRYSYDSMAYYMVNYKEFVEANKERCDAPLFQA